MGYFDYEVWELLIETIVIIAIFAFFFYMLWHVMELSKTCWWDFQSCPLKPWAETLLNSSLSSSQKPHANFYFPAIFHYFLMSGTESEKKKRGVDLAEVAILFIIVAMMLLMAVAVAIPLGVYLGILEDQVMVVFTKVFWIFLWVVVGFVIGYVVVELLT